MNAPLLRKSWPFLKEQKDKVIFFTYTFLFIVKLSAKAPGLNLGRTLSNLLSNRQTLNNNIFYIFPYQKRIVFQCSTVTSVYATGN